MDKSIANSKPLAEVQVDQTLRSVEDKQSYSYFFTRMGRSQHFAELFIAGNILSMLLALAEAQSWSSLDAGRLVLHVLYINWVLLAFTALIEWSERKIRRLSLGKSLLLGFLLLQGIILLTTPTINALIYFGQYFSFQNLSLSTLFDGVVLHLSYGILLGAFCFRYLFIREQWMRQQNSELNARIQAMQARIHPHFLFNSLNNVISLIAIDPDKAEQMLLNLSRLFRASLQELKLVSIQDEIDLCQRYLDIEQIRLGERLHVEWKFAQDDQFSRVQIPLLTLQPLLENSIFHGVEKILTKSTISILIEILQNQVNIVITNPYIQDRINSRQGHGLAVKNVKQRLQAYYGQSVIFQTYAGNGMYTTVVQYRYK